jgi:tetratricopeptide (TPR) repeat protein
VPPSRLAFALLFSLATQTPAGTPPLDAECLADAREGLEDLYHARPVQAVSAFERIRGRHPESPAADFLLGAIEWHRVTTGPQGMTAGGKAEQAFFARMDSAIALGERALERDEHDLAARFFLGGAYGYKARYLALQEEWWGAYRTGKKGVHHLEKVVEEDREFGDAYLGLGIYHYYADVVPKIVKIFGALVGLGGDRERGLEEIRRARRDGLLVEEECRFFLAEIESTFEHDQWAALVWARSLREEYPENELFTWLHARVLDELHLTDLAIAEWTELRGRVRGSRLIGFVEYRLARSVLFGGDFAGAAAKLRELLDYGRLGSARITMWGRLRYGLALDFLGRHEEALAQYRIARDLDASELAKERASARIFAGHPDPSVVSLEELAETARILEECISPAEADLLRVERMVTRPTRGSSPRELTEYYGILADLAEARLRDDRPADCVAAVDRLLESRPFAKSRARLRALRARALFRLGDTRGAIADLDRAVAEADGDDRARFARDRALIVERSEGARAETSGMGTAGTTLRSRDRGELTLDLELPDARVPMTLDDGIWTARLAPGDTLVYRLVADGEERRIDPAAPGIRLAGDEAWSVLPQPKQTNSSSSR